MKRIEVTILGQSYVLSCPEDGEQALSEAAVRVDREMCAIRDAGKLKARERIAVLAALNLAYEMAGPDTASTQSGQPGPSTASASAPGAASARPAGQGTDDTGHGAHPAAALDSTKLRALVARIDEALADDGRLI